MDDAVKVQDVRFALGDDFPEIRDSVRKICARFPGAYREISRRARRIPATSSKR